jgi:Protein of unknown function (DUF1553)/Protein of unknown function (DUF1549)/Planctomycete cytochrome C
MSVAHDRIRRVFEQSGVLAVAFIAIGHAPATADSPRGDDARSEAFFENRVRPVLAGTCFRCHGGQKVSGGLRVDAREPLVKGGESGPAIDLHAPAESLLIRAIARQEDVAGMPPDKPLPAQQVSDLTAWIKAGAPWPKQSPRFRADLHWSFQPIRAVFAPPVQNVPWVKTRIDRFILARLESAHRKPAPPADRRTLLRRVTYDLTGLPPTPEVLAAFENDTSPCAFEKVVDRLLNSPHYGEHWGRHWLDVVRYADTAGENSDHPLPHAWRYRNWVLKAMNYDEPFDQFIRDQIAGDLLAANGSSERAAAQVIATGYLAIARRFGHDIDKDMYLTHADTIDTLGKTVLGLSLGCCRCHDHKYDPLSTRDYYGLYGILESTRFPFPGCEPNQQPRDLVRLPSSLVAYAVAEGVPKNAREQRRGDPADLGPEVPRKFPDVLGGQKVQATKASGRLELATWLTDVKNPLTARVIVNRVWQWHFGRGLVATPNDFGTRGAQPTHPELLDDLARRFMQSGWRLKALHREIVLSATYQQASITSEHSPWYDSFARRRLSAEELRDTLLAASGDLEVTPGAAHPFPPETTWHFTQHSPFAAEYDTRTRSVYLMQKRNRRNRFFALFDGADPNESTPEREVTTVPTQALFFMNDPFLHARAARFAARVLASSQSEREQLEVAYRILVSRFPTDDEHKRATLFLKEYAAVLANQPEKMSRIAAWEAYSRALLSANEVLHVD